MTCTNFKFNFSKRYKHLAAQMRIKMQLLTNLFYYMKIRLSMFNLIALSAK